MAEPKHETKTADEEKKGEAPHDSHGDEDSGSVLKAAAETAGTDTRARTKKILGTVVFAVIAIAIGFHFLLRTNIFDSLGVPDTTTQTAGGGAERVVFTDNELIARGAAVPRTTAAAPVAPVQCPGTMEDEPIGTSPFTFNPGAACAWDMWFPAGCVNVQRAARTGDTRTYGPFCPNGETITFPDDVEKVWAANGRSFTISYRLRPDD